MADINDDDIKEEPTEQGADRDSGGHGSQDTGDEPTEAADDQDTGGHGDKDAGDQ